MLKGGVIMDVTNAEEARIAEEAGAVAVMALERVPADIRKDGGVARMSDPSMIKAIKAAVTIPVMAKARIGHFVEAQILEALNVDYIDESEVGGWGGWVSRGGDAREGGAGRRVWCGLPSWQQGEADKLVRGCNGWLGKQPQQVFQLGCHHRVSGSLRWRGLPGYLWSRSPGGGVAYV